MPTPWNAYMTGNYYQPESISGEIPSVGPQVSGQQMMERYQPYVAPEKQKKARGGGGMSNLEMAQIASYGIPEATGLIGALTGQKKQKERYQQFERQAEDILSRKLDYEIPQESLEMLALTKEGAGKVREYSEEALDVAKERTADEKMPGYDIIKEDIQTGQAQAAQDVVSQGGVESLGSIAQINQQSQDSLKNLALENMKHRSQAKRDYQNTLKDRANAEMAAVGLETVGLGEMAAKRDQEYQIEVLDPHYNKLQFEISQIGNKMAAMDTSIDWGQVATGALQLGTGIATMVGTGGTVGAGQIAGAL